MHIVKLWNWDYIRLVEGSSNIGPIVNDVLVEE